MKTLIKTTSSSLKMSALLLGALAFTAVTAQAQTAPQPDMKMLDAQAKEHGSRMFKKADTSGDGFVTKAEMNAAAQSRTDKMFADADTNADGKLSRAEIDAGREKMRAKMAERFRQQPAR